MAKWLQLNNDAECCRHKIVYWNLTVDQATASGETVVLEKRFMHLACVSLRLSIDRTTEALRLFCKGAFCYVAVVHAGSAHGRSEAGYACLERLQVPTPFLS